MLFFFLSVPLCFALLMANQALLVLPSSLSYPPFPSIPFLPSALPSFTSATLTHEHTDFSTHLHFVQRPWPLHNRYTRTDTFVRWGMAVAYGRYAPFLRYLFFRLFFFPLPTNTSFSAHLHTHVSFLRHLFFVTFSSFPFLSRPFLSVPFRPVPSFLTVSSYIVFPLSSSHSHSHNPPPSHIHPHAHGGLHYVSC
jgi:hypothetical protein